MKKPQIEDYATSSDALSKYSLGDMPSIQTRHQRGVSAATSQEQRTQKANARVSVDANTRSGERRKISRASFEVYDDQVNRLRRKSLEEKLNGGTLSMSEMVRDAIDRYLSEQGRGE